MIILDTCALIFNAVASEKLTTKAKKAIASAEKENQLYCCDISLWEVAMLIQKKRLEINSSAERFLNLTLKSNSITALSITPEIAEISTTHKGFSHFDPADRLIAATTLYHKAQLITCDKELKKITGLSIIW